MNQCDNVQHYQEFQICLIWYSDSFIRYSAMHTSCIPASASSFSLSGRMWKEAEISPTETQRGRLHREFVGCIRNCFSEMWLSCEVQHLTLLQLLPSESCGLALTLCWPGEQYPALWFSGIFQIDKPMLSLFGQLVCMEPKGIALCTVLSALRKGFLLRKMLIDVKARSRQGVAGSEQ